MWIKCQHVKIHICGNLLFTELCFTQCINKSSAIAGRTARCHCKFRYLSKFRVTSHSFHWNNNAFELNNSIKHGKITVLNISTVLLPLNSLFAFVCAINMSDRSKSMINDRFHWRPNCTVKCSTFLSSFGTKISHVSFFHSNSRDNVLSSTKLATHRRLMKGVSTQ